MAQTNKLLVAYSFLASLSENESDLFKGVYIPLFERGLCSYANMNKEYGKDTDIQEIINDIFGIHIPLRIVRQVLVALQKKLTRKEKRLYVFETYESGKSFRIGKSLPFQIQEGKYQEGRRNANALESAFNEYLKSEDFELDEVIYPFASFIEKNKHRLSSFFKNQERLDKDTIEETYLPHVEFLSHIEANHHELYRTAEKVFLGSIIASYLESDINLEAKFETREYYYLDTQIILEALDLQGESDTQPTIELLNLIRETGGKIKILGITVEEVHHAIDIAIKNYNKTNPTTTINEACLRIGKNRSWLITVNGKIDKYLKNELNAEIEIISDSKINQYKNTEDLKELKKQRRIKANAEHDVSAYLFVRDKRGNIRSFQKAKYWFITANNDLYRFNKLLSTAGDISEIIMPDILTSLLWLKNPLKLNQKVVKIGLNELIAITISEEYASKELINEFDNNIKNHAKDINNENYEILLESIAERFLRHGDGGAAGVIAASRESWSGINEWLVWGFMDAVYGDFVEYYGDSYSGSKKYRLGDILNYGMDYMSTEYYSLEERKFTIRQYNYFGDPSMRIYPYHCDPGTIILQDDEQYKDVEIKACKEVIINGNYTVKTGADLSIKTGGQLIINGPFDAETGSTLFFRGGDIKYDFIE